MATSRRKVHCRADSNVTWTTHSELRRAAHVLFHVDPRRPQNSARCSERTDGRNRIAPGLGHMNIMHAVRYTELSPVQSALPT